jgi:hypothetical protein
MGASPGQPGAGASSPRRGAAAPCSRGVRSSTARRAPVPYLGTLLRERLTGIVVRSRRVQLRPTARRAHYAA